RADEELPRRSRFELAPLLEEVREMSGVPDEAKIRWANQSAPGLMVEADRDHLFRILLNLTRNAVQAIQEGKGGEGAVCIAARRAGEHLHIEVADTGPGLAPKAREHLFQPFAAGARSGGAGLGLAIADELARGHGGGIELLTTGSDGTIFRVCIPMEMSTQSCAEAERQGARLSSLSGAR